MVEHGIGHEIGAAGVEFDDPGDALVTSVGEVLERYCLRFPPTESEMRTATYEELSDEQPTVDFEYLDVYDRDALAEDYAAFDRTTKLHWVAGRNLLDGSRVYVPAEHVWFNSGALDHEEFHFPVTTNGVAAGPNLAFALRNALYETVERDAIVPAWCRQRAPPGINRESAERHWPDAATAVDELAENGVDVRLLCAESAVDLPVVGSVFSATDGGFPRFGHGAGVSVHPGEAIRDAAVEAAHLWTALHQNALAADVPSLDPATHDNFESNVLYYALAENFDDVSFYFESETRPVTDLFDVGTRPVTGDLSVEEEYALVRRAFADADVTPVAFDLTTPDVERLGVRVVRVFVPELIPMPAQTVPPVRHPRIADEVQTTKPLPIG